MLFTPRPYQQKAIDAVLSHIKKSATSCLVKAPTGSGKSIIVAEVARLIKELSGKKVLCIAPSKELCEQNHEKYLSTGNPASFFSASVGSKSIRHDVVFGTPQTILNEVKKSDKFDSKFGAIVVDEAHNTSKSMRAIIDGIRAHNPNIRLIGLSATPFRTNDGYTYSNHYKRGSMPLESIYTGDAPHRKPLYDMCVYDISEWELIDQGYITRPIFGEIEQHYETSGMKVKASGKFEQSEVDKAFLGRGRLTSQIVAEVVETAQTRMGVMFFASSIHHANEIMESLPRELSAIVTGKTDKKERASIIKRSKSGEIKYLVNVDVLTTGFDSANIDLIAILRATESPALLIQIIGRALRLHDNKENALILDYAENMERHAPNGDVFNPIIVSRGNAPSGEKVDIICPECFHVNQFTVNPDFVDYPHDVTGFCITPDGDRLTNGDGKELTMHFGQRCTGSTVGKFAIRQCDYRWQYKECECGHHNSQSSRICSECGLELIDPNLKLTIEKGSASSNPAEWLTGHAIHALIHTPNQNGNLRIDYKIDKEGMEFTVSDFINPNHGNAFFARKSKKSLDALLSGSDTLDSLTERLNIIGRKSVYMPIGKPIKYRKKGDYFEIAIG